MTTTASKTRKSWRTLLGDGQAFVAGLPGGFQLTDALRNATSVKIATAFAQLGGWQQFEEGISAGKASVYLLTGRWFFLTQPALLWKWYNLSHTEDRVKASLASETARFHPKVLIVEGGGTQPDFAIVGSGNLSQGGLRDNTECSLYTENTETIRQLNRWFTEQFDSAFRLTTTLIKTYEPFYKLNVQRVKKLEKEQERATRKVTAVGEATIARWKDLVKAAKKYFHSRDYAVAYQSRQDGARRILDALKYRDDFTFDRNGWNKFYAILELGRLRGHRDEVFKRQNRLKKALQTLVAEGKDALPRVLDRGEELYVPGLGVNTVSKILASYDRKTWPVFNNRVAAVLAAFGYQAPRGARAADRYLAYKKAMDRFMVESGAPDSLALDAFFFRESTRLAKYKPD